MLQAQLLQKTETIRAYYTLVERDSSTILNELSHIASSESINFLVKSVKDSQKHFFLFLSCLENSREHLTQLREKPKRTGTEEVHQNIMPLLNEFLAEVLDYLDASEKHAALKEQKERLFSYSNSAVLEDLRKINSLSLFIKLLKKEPRTELEELKIKVAPP